jgi:hypothetical protein
LEGLEVSFALLTSSTPGASLAFPAQVVPIPSVLASPTSPDALVGSMERVATAVLASPALESVSVSTDATSARVLLDTPVEPGLAVGSIPPTLLGVQAPPSEGVVPGVGKGLTGLPAPAREALTWKSLLDSAVGGRSN